MMHHARWAVAVVAAAGLLLAVPASATNQESILVQRNDSGISFDAQIPYASAALALSGPDGFHATRTFSAGEALYLGVNDDTFGSLPDGSYSYELVMTPRIDAATRARMNQARATGDESAMQDLRAQGKIPTTAAMAYGYFTILAGAIVSDAEVEAGTLDGASGESSTGGDGLSNVAAAAQVFVTDVIAQGSLCVGFDCVNSENFGFDTYRAKENNLRFHFDDTSNSASFPANDWRIVANDTSNGGSSYLAIEDSTAGRNPFRVVAGAPANSLYVTSAGKVGIGTSAPVGQIQATTGNTPTLRLEQNGASGFTPQTWDVAGNEANFFIRDATNGSALSFRIFPGNGTDDALVIASDGDIGMGTDAPAAELHVVSNRTGSDTRFLVEEKMDLPVALMAHMKSNGRGQLVMEDTSADGDIWRFRTVEKVFNIDSQSTPSDTELVLNANNGSLTILGVLNSGSSRDIKTDIEEVNAQAVLDKVAALPISTWSYKTDVGVKHLGPMAQDFRAAFGLGETDTHIAMGDTAGVALAAVKALNLQLQQKQEEIELLKARLDALEQKSAE